MYLLHVKQRHKTTCKSRLLHCKGRRQCPPVMRDSLSITTSRCKTQLEYLPPRATLISSAADYHKKEIHAQSTSTQQQQGINDVQPNPNSKSIMTTSKPIIPQEDTPRKIRIVKSKEQIRKQYPKLFKGIGHFPGDPYHIHTNLSITPEQTCCRPITVNPKQTFRQEIEKMLTTGVIKPVHEATLWINSFVLVESKDKST